MRKFKLLKSLCMLLIAQLLVGCSSSPEKQIEERVQTMAESAELGTVEYTVKKIVKTDDDQWYSIGNRKILFSTTAYLKAGVNLEGFSAENVNIDGKNVTVTLPHAKLLSFNMPADETHTVFENYGFFRSRFSADEQNQILQLGENNIREDVPNLGILEDAEKNVTEIFTAMLSQMGFEKINIMFGQNN
ncbi:MAG: DUF4230 domain-containing protein [Bacteroidales bacterium]|nr:DUF4230 domain-containing protein [Bacteroidales bacterium]